MNRTTARLLDIALLPLTFAWWTLSYRWGFPRHSRDPKNPPVQDIDSVTTADFSDLFRRRRPVVLTGHFPWLSSWTPQFLKETIGDVQIDVNTTLDGNPNFLASYFSGATTRMSLAKLIDIIFHESSTGARYYMMGGGGWTSIGKLANEVDVPRVARRPFFPRGSGLWVGQKGNITALHYDSWHGLLGQVSGRKRVVLFSPEESGNLYAETSLNGGLGASRLPAKCLEADRNTFPRIDHAARYEAILAPGDMLYIPPYWWHYVESLDNVISLSLRFESAWNESVHPGSFPVKYRMTGLPLLRKMRGLLGTGQPFIAPKADETHPAPAASQSAPRTDGRDSSSAP